MANIVLLPFGSAGDVYPFIGIGKELTRRGHCVVAVASGYFKEPLRRAGIDLVDIYSEEKYRALIGHPDTWTPGMKSLRKAVEATSDILRLQFDYLQSRRDDDISIVSGAFCFAGRMMQDKFGTRNITLQTSPAYINSVEKPPLISGLYMPDWMPLWLRRLQYDLSGKFVDRLFQFVNDFRSEQGLAAVRRVGTHWANSPLMTLGLFPSWFCEPANDWDSFVKLSHFPMYDDPSVTYSGEKLDAFIQDYASLGKPILFCPGSAVTNDPLFFASAVDACVRLNRPGILVTNFPDQIRVDLPPHVVALTYVPFSTILTRMSAMVHHGGIGSVASCCAAGVPQIIVPTAYDQFDNGRRVAALGLGEVVEKKALSGAKLAATISALAANPAYANRCTAIRAQMPAPGAGISQICDLVLSKL